MSTPETKPIAAAPLPLDDETAELAALATAVAKAQADPRRIPHEEVRGWLLRLAEGELDAPRPAARLL